MAKEEQAMFPLIRPVEIGDDPTGPLLDDLQMHATLEEEGVFPTALARAERPSVP